MHVLALYLESITTGAWARLLLETGGGDEQIDFSCTNPPQVRAHGSKCTTNAGRRERQKHGSDAWMKKRKAATAAAATSGRASKQAAVTALAEATAALSAAATATCVKK